MAKVLSKSAQEKLNLLNGCEVNSLNYENCILVRGNKVIDCGEVVDVLDDDEKVNELWGEYISEEGF
jgi:hypothetical protein